MNWKAVSHLSIKEIKRFQDKKIRAFVKYQLPYHPFYRDLFKKNNLKFSDIKTTDDLVKIPFTSKIDIAPTEKDPSKPLRFVLQPTPELIKRYLPKTTLSVLALQKVVGIDTKKKLEYEYKPIHIHFTTGRTALPTAFFYSAKDLELLEAAGKRMMDCFGITSEDRVINAFPFFPHLAFWQTFYSCRANKLLAIHTGGGKILGTKRIIKAIESMKASVLIAMPSYAYHIIREAHEQKAKLGALKFLILGGEKVSDGLRDKIRKMLMDLGAKEPQILATYALTEGKVGWPQCCELSSYHLYPDMEFIEIVDKNGERVSEGEKGEIVYTSLDWRASTLLRYKTGDISRLETDKCPYCNRTVQRISQEIERVSEIKEFALTKVKGTLINLNVLSLLLTGHPSIDEWQLELRKKNNDPYEIDELIIYVAPKKAINFEALKKQLANQIKTEIGITPTDIIKITRTELLERLGMERELKEKRIIDNRPKK